MGMFQALSISASGLSAQRLRMDVVANNLANADSTLGPGQAYRRKVITLVPNDAGGGFSLSGFGVDGSADPSSLAGVKVASIDDLQGPLRKVYMPGDPNADAKGFVTKPNVDTVTEMVDLIAATRAYQANVTAMNATKDMALDTLKVLR